MRRGLEALARDAPDFVLIHDAARPLVSPRVIGDVADALANGAEGVLPMVAASDTLRRRESDGRFTLVSRDNLYRAQTPRALSMARSWRRIAPMPPPRSPTMWRWPNWRA